MQYFTLENLIIFVAILLFGYGCAHSKYLKSEPARSLSNKLAAFVLVVDELTPDVNITGVVVLSIKKAIAFMSEAEDGVFGVGSAIGILQTIDTGDGTLREKIGPRKMRILELLVDDLYVDMSKVGDRLPVEINAEFAKKFKEVLSQTAEKLQVNDS